MSAQLVAALIDGVIPLAGGLYMSLIGFDVMRPSRAEPQKLAEWMRRWGTFMRIGGPLIAMFGVFQIARAFV